VFGLSDKFIFALAIAFYGLSSLFTFFLWRQGFRKDDHINYGLIGAGFLCHTGAMISRGFSFSRCPITNLYEATAFITWTIVLAYLLMGIWSRLRFLGAFASPLLFTLGVFALMPSLDTHTQGNELPNAMRSIHASLILLACGGFGISAVASAMFLVQEHDLKFNKLRAIHSLIPSIQRLGKIAFQMLIVATTLMSLGLVSGGLRMHQLEKIEPLKDPFIFWSGLVWLFYVTLLITHWRSTVKGPRFARRTLGAFLFVILTYWGFYLLSPMHHL